jgi:hypothetical protein
MPRTPPTRRGVPYQDAIDALHRINLMLIKISAMPRLPGAARAELQEAMVFIALLLASDNGRSR